MGAFLHNLTDTTLKILRPIWEGAIERRAARDVQILAGRAFVAIALGIEPECRATELIAAIDENIAVHNQRPKPFIWTAKANDILQKVIRANRRLSSKQNEAPH